ncbi:MAG: hypothetical protein LC624_12535 [Halobacteriales archaeon]|nr:hypothetical protein [Halobacteriales archaeon]
MDELPPAGVRLLGLVYIVLGGVTLMVAAFVLTAGPGATPFGGDIAVPYGAGLAAAALAYFVLGAALHRGKRWARWGVLGLAWLHLVTPPFLLGGLLLALAANVYLFGSARAHAWFRGAAAPAVSQG